MTDEQRAIDLVRRAAAEGLAPDPIIGLADWSDQHVELSAKDSAEPGPWRTSRVPFMRAIMQALSPTSPHRRVVLMKGTQIAGTSIGKNLLAFIMATRGGPTMYLLPTSAVAKRVSKTRIAPMIDSMPILRDKIGDKRSRDSSNTVLLKEFDGGILVLAGANSAAELRSQPIKNLIADEVDNYPIDVDGEGAPLELAEKRTDTFTRKKIFIVSTPGLLDNSVINKEFKASDQQHYYVPCPHCEHLQQLRWEQMKWQAITVEELTCTACGAIGKPGPHCEHCGHDTNDQQITERDTGELGDVWYECEACAQRIEEYHKTNMLERGEWRAHAPGADKAVGFHVSALYSPLGWFSWRDAVKLYRKAEQTKDTETEQVFYNTVLGLPYEIKGEQPEADPLLERANKSDYRIGNIPAPALMLTAFVDVQGDRLEAYVYGWGRGENAYLIDFQILHGETAVPFTGAWAQLPDLLDKGYPHKCGATMRIAGMGIDSGFNTTCVYLFARAYKSRGVIATKGQSQPGKAIIGAGTVVDINHAGRKIKKGTKVYPLGADTGKALVYRRLKIEPPQPGAWHFPQGLPHDVFKQLVAEKCVVRHVRGFAIYEWRKDKNARNEALDCAVGAYAVAVQAGLHRVNWDHLESLVAPKQRDMLAASEPPRSETMPAEDEAHEVSHETPAPADAASEQETQTASRKPPPQGNYLAQMAASRRRNNRRK